MHSSLLTLLAILLVDALLLTVGILAWVRNPRSGFAPSFFLVTLTGILWSTSNYYSYTTTNLQLTVIATRITLAAGLWTLLSIYYFTLRFPSGVLPSSLVRWSLVPIAVVGGIFSVSKFVIASVAIERDTVIIRPGPAYVVYIILLVIVITLALYTLYRQHLHASLVGRNQIRYVSFGVGITAIVGTIMNAILPIFYPAVGGAKINLVLITLFILFVGYGIIRNRYVDIHTLSAKLLTYLVCVGILTVIFAISKYLLTSSFHQEETVLNGLIIIAALAALLVQPLRNYIELRVNLLVRRHWYDAEGSFRRVSEIVASEQRLDPLLQTTLDFLCQQLGVTSGAFIIVNDQSTTATQQFDSSIPQHQPITLSFDELARLRVKSLILLADELKRDDSKRVIMDAHQIRMAAQLIDNGKLVGYLVMGNKMSGDIFTRQDVRVLNILSNQLAVAIVRSQGYEQISQFNNTLERKVEEATHELREARDKLQADDRMKSEFIMLTSHNLRTPLAVISGYTDMIGETTLSDDQHKYFEAILASMSKLKQLVDDLLTIATLEGGQEFVHKPVAISEILEPLVDQIKQQQHNSKVSLSVIIDVGDAMVNANLLRLRAAFWNILDNAIKFTREGKIEFEAQIESDKLVVTIDDTGIGIPSEELPTIFNKFHRASSTLQYDFDGEGIGLYLAKLIVEEHVGQIDVTSQPNKGTRVVISIPLAADTDSPLQGRTLQSSDD